MADLESCIDDLAALMDEFGLERARWVEEEWSVEFDRRSPRPSPTAQKALRDEFDDQAGEYVEDEDAPSSPVGVPVSSPTTGIFYSSPNPGAPPFVQVGDRVEAGQVIGLIEAMKVFNEVTSTVAGTVVAVVASSGQLVNPGDPLILVG